MIFSLALNRNDYFIKTGYSLEAETFQQLGQFLENGAKPHHQVKFEFKIGNNTKNRMFWKNQKFSPDSAILFTVFASTEEELKNILAPLKEVGIGFLAYYVYEAGRGRCWQVILITPLSKKWTENQLLNDAYVLFGSKLGEGTGYSHGIYITKNQKPEKYVRGTYWFVSEGSYYFPTEMWS